MEAVTTALTATLADASGLVVGAIAALFAIPVTLVGLKIGKRLLNKA